MLSGLAIGGISFAAGWVGTDLLERDDDFCNACHLGSGIALHLEQRRETDSVRSGGASTPASLAALHGAATVEMRPEDPGFRCIDCHGGTGLLGRARVKVLAAKDAAVWLTGRFEEPEGMHWPLLEDDCRQCHESFAPKAGAFEDPAFHDLEVHNHSLGVDCVECHEVHERGVDPDRWFLNATHVRTQCARCHRQFEEGRGT